MFVKNFSITVCRKFKSSFLNSIYSKFSTSQKESLDAQALKNFRAYLQIPSTHPNVDYEPCVQFLEKQATSIDIPIKIYYLVPKKPVILFTWVGSEPNLPSILLNSHMDVVPIMEKLWTHKPFKAEIDEQNKIIGRGTQDMKSVGIQYLEAVRRLKLEGVRLKRTIHITFVPDQEIGGADGMQQFIQTKEFQNLNVGVALDEGTPSPNEDFVVFYGERCVWYLHIHCPGSPGHGSLFLENTSGEKLTNLLSSLYHFRTQEIKRLKEDRSLSVGDVITVNLTKVKGGMLNNVVPPEFVATFDCRIPPHLDFKKWEDLLVQMCNEAGSGVWVEYELKQTEKASTKLDDSNPYWVAFKQAAEQLGIKLKPQVCTSTTDAGYVRNLGLPVFGFSPINNTPVLVHAPNEYVTVDTFLRGIEIYCKILTTLGNLGDVKK